MNTNATITIIIPVFNEEGTIGRTLARLRRMPGIDEIIVVDGGSRDATCQEVDAFSEVRLLRSAPGRAVQLNAGAAEATGEYLFFLHADTLPPLDATERIRNALADPDVLAGSFFIDFDRQRWAYRVISFFTRHFQMLTFGDQGLFLRAETFQQLGGFPDIPVMEDFEIQRRLRQQGRFVKVDRPVLTSARRFERNGVYRQMAIDFLILTGYLAGISPHRLKKLYSDAPRYSRSAPPER